MQMKLIVTLLLILCFTVLPAIADGGQNTSPSTIKVKGKTKYPPYPDVWGYEFPMSQRFGKRIQLRVQATKGGDYAVIYLTDDGTSKGIYFFSGEAIAKKDAYRYREKSHIAGNSAGRSEVKIADEVSWEQGQTCFVCCPELSKFVITKYAPVRTNEQRSIVYFSEKPIRTYYTVPFEKCIGKGAWQRFNEEFFFQQVFEVFPWFVPLKDGTFLLYDSLGNFIIRLDKNFKSKSDLLNKKVFIVHTEDIKAIETRLFEADVFNRQTYDNAMAGYIKILKQSASREAALEAALKNIENIKKEISNGN